MNEIITSASNGTVKRLRKLMTSSKERRETDNYVAEGIHLVRSFLTSQQTPLLYFCAESSLKNPEVSLLDLELADTKAERVVFADSLFESITDIHASVGIGIVFTPLKPSPVLKLENSAVLLENIQDPGNIGTVLRTVAAVGMSDVFLSPECASVWSPKALRAGMGAQFSLSLHEGTDVAELTKTAGVPVLATTLTPDSQSLFDADLKQPTAWLFGNEGQGLSEPLIAHATSSMYIPQAPTSVESLNVAAAAAVCLYEQYRQNSV